MVLVCGRKLKCMKEIHIQSASRWCHGQDLNNIPSATWRPCQSWCPPTAQISTVSNTVNRDLLLQCWTFYQWSPTCASPAELPACTNRRPAESCSLTARVRRKRHLLYIMGGQCKTYKESWHVFRENDIIIHPRCMTLPAMYPIHYNPYVYYH